MANHKSAMKRVRQNEKRRLANRIAKAKMKTLMKKFFETKNKEEAEKIYKEAVAHIDRISLRGRLHKNNAARKKSRLTVHLNKLSAAE